MSEDAKRRVTEVLLGTVGELTKMAAVAGGQVLQRHIETGGLDATLERLRLDAEERRSLRSAKRAERALRKKEIADAKHATKLQKLKGVQKVITEQKVVPVQISSGSDSAVSVTVSTALQVEIPVLDNTEGCLE